MKWFTRLFLISSGLLLLVAGVTFIWAPDLDGVWIIAGVIGFITGGGLLAIAFFHE